MMSSTFDKQPSSSRSSASLLRRAVAPIVERLEGRQLFAGDPLAYQNVVQTLPYALDFTSAQNGVFDKNGQGTGFTLLQPNRLGTQYQPNLILLNTAAGELDLTTTGTNTSGSNYSTDNTLANALETRFDATTSGFTITTRLKGPLSQLNANYDSAGVFFGPDQDNYVKFVAEYDSTKGQTLQFIDEQGATTHTVNTYQGIGSFANLQTLDLRLTGDAGTGQVTASFSINGNAFVAMPGTLTLAGTAKNNFFAPNATGGIMALSRNSLPQITVPFSRFEIGAGHAVTSQPSIRFTSPAPGATGVAVDSPIEADLNLPNSAINAQTISSGTVYLYRSSDKSQVAAVVNTSGGGDSIILTPTSVLAANTQYTFVVTAGVQDTSGASIVPYQMTFTTGAPKTPADPTIQFQTVNLPSATGAAFTGVKIGPDGKLYAASEDGRMFRWPIKADGTLGTPQVFTGIQTLNGGQKRLITGFAFDPASTASNPILWVSNSYYALSGATTGVDFTGKITVMSGPNLATVQDAIVNLPRSVADHSTEQPTFGPDGMLYFAQASNTAYGAPDSTWGNRSEHLLTAAILRLDTKKLNLANGPLDVKTYDVGGAYNPYATGSPLTIYATGVRNAFSMTWTSDGKLLAVNNGSSAGGNTPGYTAGSNGQINGTRMDSGQPYSGLNVPALNNVQQTESDYLYDVSAGGYYGHPNAYRGEYVLNGGNPSSALDPNEISAYPVGTQADANYRGSAWDFGPHASADGIIEYQDKTFGGKLQGALLVTEYSAGSDIVMLQRDASGHVISQTRGIAGFTSLNNPLSLVEDLTNGNIYVSELGGQRIVLLRPIVPHATASASKASMVFNDIASAYSGGSGASPAQAVVITNTGTTPLNFAASGAFSIGSDPTAPTNDAANFAITNLASLPTTLAPGASMTITVTYTANKAALQYARLLVNSNDPAGPLSISLRGIGTTGTGGANEPSLPRILRAYGIPTTTGDGANDASQDQTFYPASPDASSQEAPMQRLQKAGDGPVSIQVLASFNAANATNPMLRFGYYTPGSTSAMDKSELFTLNNADAQTVNPTPNGSTSFDPGAGTFGLYTIFPHFVDSGKSRISYSEDALNTWDANVPRKVRFFPLQNSDGSVVPNAYVFAFEDNNIPYGSIQPYDSNDIVAIIRNVKAAPNAVNAPAIGVENLDGAPFSDRLVFNRIQVPNSTSADVVHDTGSLLVRNTGSQPMNITSLTLSDAKNWQLVNPPTLPISIAPGGTLTLTVKFVAQAAPSHTVNQLNDPAIANDPGYNVLTAGGLWSGTLTIVTDDPATPSKTVTLAGWWQHLSEHEEEPGLQTMINLIYGYQSNIASTYVTQYPNNGSSAVYYGEEVANPYWTVADATQQVAVQQLASWHNQFDANNNLTAAFFGYFPKGSSTVKYLFGAAKGNAQSLNPLLYGGTGNALAKWSFTPNTSTFGFALDGAYSDDSLNTVDVQQYGRSGHDVRMYPVRDRSGNLVPNAYLACLDYGGGPYENADFQDNVYLITNVKPVATAPVPLNAQASANASGGILLAWQAVASASLQGYNVYRSTSLGGTYAKLNTAPITTTSYLDAQPTPGVTSYYRVTSVDGNGESIPANASAAAVPAAPYGLSAASLSAGAVKLGWTAAPGATAYRIEREIFGGSSFVEVGIASGNTYTDSGLLGSTLYVYQVRAENGSGLGAYSNVASASTPSGVAPGVPTNVKASVNASNQLVLTWSAPASGAVTAYHVERQAPGETVFTEIAGNVTGLTFTDGSVAPGTSYTYRVRAENAGTLGAYSATAGATTGIAAPTNLQAVVVAAHEIDLSWAAPAAGGVTSYHVERFDPTAATPQWLEVSNAAGTTYNDTAAAAGVSYQYRVRAEKTGAFSGYCGPISASTPSGPPASPANFTAVANSSTQVTLTWSASAEASSYVLQRTGGGSATWTTISGAYATGTSFVDNTAQSGTAYTYQVAAQNVDGASAFVQADTATPAPAFASADVAATPAGNTVTNVDGASYDVTAGGVDIGSTNTDSFRFVYQPRTGDFDAVVQVLSLGNTNNTAKAGLMVRATLDPASPMVFDGATAASSFRFLYRATQNATATFSSVGPTVNYPNVYLRLVRKGNAFTGYYGTDGLHWTQAGTVTLALPQTVYFGLATSSHNSAVTTTAQYRNLTVLAAPPAPTLAVQSTDTNSASLSWTSVPSASSYSVLRYNPATSSYQTIASGLANSAYQDTGLTPSTAYQYEVIATNAIGSSPPSNVVTATTLGAPAAPANLSADASSPGQVTLNWTAPAGATAYTVQRSGDNGQTWTTLTSTAAQATYIDATVAASTLYTYRVTATNSAGASPAAQVSVTSAAVPGAPGTIAQTGSTPTSISISWTPSSGQVSEYRVERFGGGDAGFHLVSPAGLTATSFTDTGLTAGQSYQYRVYAVNGAGASAYSGPVTLSTQAALPAPGQVGQPTAAANNAYKVTVTWSAPSGTVTLYHLLRSTAGGAFTEIGTSTTTTAADTTAQPNTSYAYEVVAENSGSLAPASPASNAVTTPQPAFSSADINSTPGGATTIVADGSAYDLTAGGAGMYNNADGFRFIYKQVSNDFDIKVQVAGLTTPNVSGVYPQAGLMARTSLDAGAQDVAITASPVGGYRFKYRPTAGAATTQTQTSTSVTANFPSVYVRLKRVGNVFTTYYSANGSTWTTMGSVTLTAPPATMFIGMAAASNTTAATTTAQFRGFTGA